MIKIMKMGSAFIGIIVGAGFASGQEILQYFTSFGMMGIAAAIVSTALFAYIGMALTRLGSRLRTTSHKEVIYKISGRFLGTIIDYIIIFTLFGVGVVMVAGAGSNLEQQFGIPSFVGSLLMVVLVFITILLNVDKVVAVIGSITPFLILAVVGVAVYCLVTMDTSFAVLDPIAQGVDTTLPNWFISAVNYVSFNIAVGASMSLVMGGAEKDERTAALGGLVGGLGLGILILLSHLAIFSKVDVVGDAQLPMLAIINDISPALAIFMAFVLYGMIFNTAVSMFYAFGARFVKIGTKNFKLFVLVTLVIGFAVSFLGFKNLVAYFYPLIGYLGLLLSGILIVASVKLPEKVRR
ncbi:YkvI family membrane protein [Sporosarcina sp. SAFN-015]|uniref:YkvI family membrane protein n=1 Tax=Sporosarcina sp. SAFN-015 TaxID=3387274 RepID=UPI003F8130A3